MPRSLRRAATSIGPCEGEAVHTSRHVDIGDDYGNPPISEYPHRFLGVPRFLCLIIFITARIKSEKRFVIHDKDRCDEVRSGNCF